MHSPALGENRGGGYRDAFACAGRDVVLAIHYDYAFEGSVSTAFLKDGGSHGGRAWVIDRVLNYVVTVAS